MTCRVVLHTGPGSHDVHERAVTEALSWFHTVETACTRFDPQSPLMCANRRPNRWHVVPPVLHVAVREAHRAYQRTAGLFDPRVLRELVQYGYDHSLAFAEDNVSTSRGTPPPAHQRGPWNPGFRGGPKPQLRLGPHPIELGGIGKGLAIRWAAQHIEPACASFLLEAGGDCIARGRGPDGPGWHVGIEDPRGGDDPLAVVELQDRACATSSIRVRRWRCGGRVVHHLVDPRTGKPGGAGLLSVTVLASDPADAEVASKTLFLRGAQGIAAAAARQGAAAFWVTDDGRTGESPTFGRHAIWRRR